MNYVEGEKDKVIFIEVDEDTPTLYNIAIRNKKSKITSYRDDIIFSKFNLNILKTQVETLLISNEDVELGPIPCECGEELVRLSKIDDWYFINIYTSHNRMKEKYHSISFEGSEKFKKLEELIERL